MAVKIKFDNQNVAESPTIVLLRRNGDRLGVIQAKEIHFTGNLNSAAEITFKVHKEDNGKKTNLWDDIRDFRLIWCKEWNIVFEIYVEIDESDETTKNVSGTSLAEVELSNTKLFGIEVNTEDDILSDDYIPTLIYRADPLKKRGSLLDRLLSKIPIYSIKHIDVSIANLQRTFTFDDITVYDAFQEIAQEVNCIFIFDSSIDNDGNITRTFSVYDLESYCLDCGHRDEFIGNCPNCGSDNVKHGYGDDTTIFITTDNLADDVGFSTDTESVKNCFRLEAGDDLMTDTIANVNPNGSRYIWFIPDETKEDMSNELTSLLNNYDELYAYFQNEYNPNNTSISGSPTIPSDIIESYNTLVTKYREYDSDLPLMPTSFVGYSSIMEGYYNAVDFQIYLQSGLMPSVVMQPTSAQAEAAKLTNTSLSPVAVSNISSISVSTASSAVLSVAKTIVNPKYQVKVTSSSLSGTQWSGQFTITNYSDEDDTATSANLTVRLTDDKKTYLEQRIDVVLSQKVEESSDIVDLFNMTLEAFTNEIKKYCLARLNSFHDSCQSCLDILLEQGVADPDKWGTTSTGLYNTMYLPYYNKLSALESEIALRESEIRIVGGTYDQYDSLIADGMITVLQDVIYFVQDELNFQNYVGSYWNEFISFRREDVYSNSNYISDGLSNSEIIKQANEFLETAQKEIYKSATQQHSLTSSLKNLLVLKEFKPIVDYFELGNWIRVKIDDKIYRLRLISYDIDFDNIENLSVSFSDVRATSDGLTDAESIMNQAKSMASSYGYVTRQASQGEKSKELVDGWTKAGLDMTKLKIVDNADNQEITWDSHGVLCKELYPELDSYSDKQLKMINTGIYLTDDNWQSSKTAIGNFFYNDPETGDLIEAYGVNGETLIGTLILGERLGIYNQNATLKFDQNGLYVSNGVNTFTVNPNASENMIALSKGSSDILTVDEYGNLIIIGNITARTLKIGYDDINLYAESNGIVFRDGIVDLASFGADGATIGKTDGSSGYIVLQSDSFSSLSKNEFEYFSVSDLAGKEVTIRLLFKGTADNHYDVYELDTSVAPTAEDESGNAVTISSYSRNRITIPLSTQISGETFTVTYTVRDDAEYSNVKLLNGAVSLNKGVANSVFSVAEGSGTAYGIYSHAEGENTTTFSSGAHAEGGNTKAQGIYSHAEGLENVAQAGFSHAGGWYSRSLAQGSFVHGYYLQAVAENQAVFGKYNNNDFNSLFLIGNGTSDNARSNAFGVYTDGSGFIKGNFNVGGTLTVNGFGNDLFSEEQRSVDAVTVSGDGTWHSVDSISLQKGKYIVIYGAQFESNATGYRGIHFGANSSAGRYSPVLPATSGAITKMNATITANPSSTTTYHLYLNQNSGTVLNCYAYTRVIKIG